MPSTGSPTRSIRRCSPPSPTISESLTVAAALGNAAVRLGGSEEARRDARVLLSGVLGVEGGWLLAHAGDPVAECEAKRFADAVTRRCRGEPVAYILGEASFYGLRFGVSSATLVPRPESEALVERALKACPSRLCDVGTGSGALAIAVATALPRARVVAIDVAPDALAVAARNIAAHGLDGRVELRCGDLLAALRPGERFEVVLANLPYVPTVQLAAPPDPTSFEPRLALDGGPDGLDVYRRLLAALPAHLAPGGLALLEAAPPTAEALAQLAGSTFPDGAVEIVRDYAGLERIVAISLYADPDSPNTDFA